MLEGQRHLVGDFDVDTAQEKFLACYPFHPATISVFQRKWQTLSQYQQTRGTLAMLAQWISKAAEKSYREARKEPLITLGSAPLQVPEFRSIVLGQLGESRLVPAIDTDIAGGQSHARALDADTAGQEAKTQTRKCRYWRSICRSLLKVRLWRLLSHKHYLSI